MKTFKRINSNYKKKQNPLRIDFNKVCFVIYLTFVNANLFLACIPGDLTEEKIHDEASIRLFYIKE